MSKIKKRDRDLEWYSVYRDLENPGRLKAKQSSNMVFIGSAVVIGAMAIIYVIVMNQNMALEREIQDHKDYVESPTNIDLYEWHLLLQSRSESLVNYRDGAEKFLEQLKTTDRISEADYRFYEEALKESTGEASYISSFSRDYNSVDIIGEVTGQDMPRMYAEYLTNLKDEEGNPRFVSVEYTGFSQSSDNQYTFNVKVTLWTKLQ